MKLTSVEIHPANSSDIVALSFRDPTSSMPYNVSSILGLDADDIVPRSYGSSGSTKFYNLSLEKREIVLKIGFNPNFEEFKSYSDLRDVIYRMISSSRTGKIQIQFKNGTDVIAAISGFVSKFESALFEKTQQIQLTVKCDEPMLRALEPVRIVDLTAAGSVIQSDLSTAPHGFSFTLDILGSIDDLTITDPEDDTWSFEIIPAGGFLAEDVLYFSSEYNDKQLFIIRDEVVIYLADVITPSSIWPILFPGDNTFSFTHPESLDWNAISYYPTYWGV